MAVSTVDYYIKPEDGWTLLATAPKYAFVKPASFHPWYLAISASSPSLAAVAATDTLTFTGSPSNSQVTTIGGVAYRAVTAYDPESPGARDFVIDSSGVTLNAIINGRSAVAAVQATGTATLSVGLPNNGGTVTVGNHTYTYKTTLTPAAYEVLIGATFSISGDNLAAAVNAGAGSGTLYGAGTVANTQVTAVSDGSGVVTFTAIPIGFLGNAVVLTESTTNLVVSGSGTLTGGTNVVPAVTANPYVSSGVSANVVTLTALVPGTTGNTIAVTENLSNVALASATLTGGADPILGTEHKLNCWEYGNGAVALGGNVYARVISPAKDDLHGGLRLSALVMT